MALVPMRLDGAPPTLLFVPPGEHDALPLVLLGHGAHLSKDDPVMQILAKGFCRNVPAAVALMDCPGHGERRAAGVTDAVFETDIARRLSDPANYLEVRGDWCAVEAAARAADARIKGATGLRRLLDGRDVRTRDRCRPALGDGSRVRARRSDPERRAQRPDPRGVRRLGDREVLMLNMTRDEHFPMDGALEVFASIPGPKRMGVWDGTHVDIPPEAIALAVDFFRRALA